MSLRYKGGLISPSVNPLAANVTTSPSVAQYNGVFNLQEQGRAITSGEWCTDPYYKNTTLLLHADGKANGSQNNTFLDSSTNAFAITRNGNTTQGSFTPYGPTWSNYFDGGSTSNIPIPTNPVAATGTFTVECWVYVTNSAASQVVYSQYTSANAGRWQIFWNDVSNKFSFAIASTNYNSTNTYANNTWHHIAWVRDGSNNLSFYIDGVRDSTTASVSTSLDTTNPTIGNRAGSATPYYGYISNLRITNTVVYTGTNYTIPTGPLTAVTGTTLLTCQSNRFKDNSTNNYAMVPNGTGVSVQRFSPFAPQYQYTPAVIGGSGYFDGSGDYLQSVTGSSGSPGSGDFCAEAWIYPQNTTTMAIIGNLVNSGGSDTQWGLYMNKGSNYIQFQGWFTVFATGAAPALNTWNHVAACRSGTTLSLFLNGTRIATTTSANNFSSTNDIRIGAEASGTSPFFGYIADARFVKGSSVYTPSSTTITVPTAPLTAVTNTQLLTNMTNAGITDNAMMNNLETVGNAQVSTSVVKYGSGSMYFDGTGDWLYSPTGTNFGFGTGDFTLECWVYPTAWAGTTDGFVSCERGASTVSGVQISRDGIEIGNNSTGSTAYAWSTSIPLNTWTHVAATRSNGVVRGFLNGVLSTTPGTNTTDLQTTQACAVGRRLTDYGGYYMTGYLDDVRITKGVARYTANFQPPKVAMANQ